MLFVITACGHVVSALAFLVFGTSSGHSRSHAVNTGADIRSLTQTDPLPLGEHRHAPSTEEELAAVEHQISPADDEDGDDDDDIDAAMMTSQTTVDDPRWRLLSGSYYY